MIRSKQFKVGEVVGTLVHPMTVGKVGAVERDRTGKLSYLVSGYAGVYWYPGSALVRMTKAGLREGLNPVLSSTSQARREQGNGATGPTLPALAARPSTELWVIGGVLQPVEIRRVG